MARVLSFGLLITTGVSFLIGAVSGLAALGQVQGGNRELMRAIMLGPFSPPETFTAAGWRHTRRAAWAAAIAFTAFAVWAFTS